MVGEVALLSLFVATVTTRVSYIDPCYLGLPELETALGSGENLCSRRGSNMVSSKRSHLADALRIIIR